LNLLSDVITYVRRIIKSPSNAQVSDNLIIDYINRFWLMDVDARVQLFDLKTKYQFQTSPGIDQYNMPLYDVQTEPGAQTIAMFPVYQGFSPEASVNGIQIPVYTQRVLFENIWPNYIQSLNPVITADGTAGPYTVNLPFMPAIPGHVDITGIIATGVNQDPPFGNVLNTAIPSTSIYPGVYFTAVDANGNKAVVSDSGQFLLNSGDGDLYGLLMIPGNAPFGYSQPFGGYSTTLNTVNYNTGVASVTFATPIPAGNNIQAQCYFIQQGLPRAMLYYNNVITLRSPPDKSYLVEIDAYLTPAAFLNTTSALPFGYMAEYIARGAARKMLADTGDVEQFSFYEPLFREQEMLVWKRSQRQFTATRTPTIFSDQQYPGYANWGQGGT